MTRRGEPAPDTRLDYLISLTETALAELRAVRGAVAALGERVDGLAAAVQVVMAARTKQESGGERRRT